MLNHLAGTGKCVEPNRLAGTGKCVAPNRLAGTGKCVAPNRLAGTGKCVAPNRLAGTGKCVEPNRYVLKRVRPFLDSHHPSVVEEVLILTVNNLEQVSSRTGQSYTEVLTTVTRGANT